MTQPRSGPTQQTLSTGALLDAIRLNNLLSTARVEELSREAQQGRFPDVQAMVRWLVERGWLSRFQLEYLERDRGQELQLGPYVLIERLGEDVTGQVFRARHRVLNRVVALKVIRRELAVKLDPAEVDRFYSEVEVLARLDHAHVGHAYDAGPVSSTHFLAAEYVEGVDLFTLVQKDGPLGIERACDYVSQVAAGLNYLHLNGLVHRNLQPSNLVVVRPSAVPAVRQPGSHSGADSSFGFYPWGMVKVLNFGLSSLRRLGDAAPVGAVTEPPKYIAPEQVLDPQDADVRADLYSLGSVFYYLLTGKEPVGRHRLEAPELLKRLRPEVPPALVAIVGRLMEGRREDRFATPAELQVALAAATATTPSAASTLGAAVAASRPTSSASRPTSSSSAPGRGVATDWDAITTSPVAGLEPPAQPSSVPSRGVLVGLGLGLVGLGTLAVLALAVAFLGRGSQPPPPEVPHRSQWELDLEEELSRRDAAGWVPLRPARAISKEGATTTLLDDYSVLVSGKLPDFDVYTITLRTVEKDLTGLRLEVLPHDSLPKNGFSRDASGNFILSGCEIEVAVSDEAPRKTVRIARVAADYEQKDWPIGSLTKVPPGPGWAVHGGPAPEKGRKAIFVFEEPIPGGPRTVLTVRLRQKSAHAKQLIGRFRLSITTVNPPPLP